MGAFWNSKSLFTCGGDSPDMTDLKMPLLACFPYLAFLRGDPCEVLPEEREEKLNKPFPDSCGYCGQIQKCKGESILFIVI